MESAHNQPSYSAAMLEVSNTDHAAAKWVAYPRTGQIRVASLECFEEEPADALFQLFRIVVPLFMGKGFRNHMILLKCFAPRICTGKRASPFVWFWLKGQRMFTSVDWVSSP